MLPSGVSFKSSTAVWNINESHPGEIHSIGDLLRTVFLMRKTEDSLLLVFVRYYRIVIFWLSLRITSNRI